MRIVDADSHFMEPLDWLQQVDPGLASQIPQHSHLEVLLEVLGGDVFSSLPVQLRPDPLDLVPKSLRALMEPMIKGGDEPTANQKAAELYQAAVLGAPETYQAEARLRWLDKLGIDVQLVLPSAGIYPYKSAMKHGLHELRFKALEAYNTWATRQLAGYTERLIPVTLVDLADPDWATSEISRVRAAGSRAVWIKSEPAGDKSLSHPDLERFWATAEDLGMTIVLHVGAGRPPFNHAWANNGGRAFDVLRLHRLAMPLVPQLAVGSLVLGGVLERHPRLGVLVAELGLTWIPELVRSLDRAVKDGFDYDLPLKPSEYIQRQVRVAALRLTDHVQPTLSRSPEGVIVFSTDFGHPEGSAESFEIFSKQLGDADDQTRARFFGGSAAEVLGV